MRGADRMVAACGWTVIEASTAPVTAKLIEVYVAPLEDWTVIVTPPVCPSAAPRPFVSMDSTPRSEEIQATLLGRFCVHPSM